MLAQRFRVIGSLEGGLTHFEVSIKIGTDPILRYSVGPKSKTCFVLLEKHQGCWDLGLIGDPVKGNSWLRF